MAIQEHQEALSYVTGFAGLALFWFILLIATGKHPWALVMGEDGLRSTSKFQMLVWTAAVVFAFLAIYFIRFINGSQELPTVPTHLLIAMGISVATAVSAKSIAVTSQAKSDAATAAANIAVAAAATAGVQVVTPSSAPTPDQSGILADDSGSPDLGKVQLVLWTLIAVGVFLSQVVDLLHYPGHCPPGANSPCTVGNMGLPDISQTLMILMGLGHGAYIGKKIAES
jgi:hypothetical protein